jgi:two-component system, cell cycle response regulator
MAPLLRWGLTVNPMMPTEISRAALPVPAQALKVLIADDDPDSRDCIEQAVRALGYSCEVARDGIEAWEMYQADRADVILSDWRMPRMDGLHLCQKVRDEGPSPSYTHFIFITANDDKAHFIDGMHGGADDFIAKPIDIDELEARLEAARRVVLVQRELREHNASLLRESERSRIDARTDPLTDVPNRLALKEDLEALAARAARYGHGYCAALCDIDGFKAYNDHFGHLSGDEVLRRVAHEVHDALRLGDVCYRYGGEEFLVILPEQSLAEATLGMDRVRRAVERLEIPHAPSTGLQFVTISVGLSVLSRAPLESTDDWLRRADAALYVAKASGRNRVCVEGDGLAPGKTAEAG